MNGERKPFNELINFESLEKPKNTNEKESLNSRRKSAPWKRQVTIKKTNFNGTFYCC